jgi:hypothetical protein
MVCLRNISVGTLHKGDTEDDDVDNDGDNNNNNNNFINCVATSSGSNCQRFEYPQRKEMFLLSTTTLNGSGNQPASLLLKKYQSCDGDNSRGVKLTTHLFQAPTLRMSGAIPLLPLHDFMECKGTTLKDLYGNALRGWEGVF